MRLTHALNENADAFGAEVARLRAQGVPGSSGRLRDLLDFLAERGPDAAPASQAEIALAVFREVQSDADDATVRVYVHRLRKKLEEHYRDHPPEPGAAVLEIPAGSYTLRLAGGAQGQGAQAGAGSDGGEVLHAAGRAGQLVWLGLATLALVLAFAGGWLLQGALSNRVNAIWQPLMDSERPVLLVLGDYYLFGEIDPVRPDEGRLIRDFRVNSAEDLLRMQEAEPDRYGMAEDVGLNYLPFQTAFALEDVSPLLQRGGKQVQVIAASDLTSAMLSSHDVVYIGLLSGMGLLEEITFSGSSLRIGESYDEIVDRVSGQVWLSDEARRLASPAFYRDHAYIGRFTAPGGALVLVLASERVTGLRGVGAIVSRSGLPAPLAERAAGHGGFEALFQVTGQQGADLSDRLILARSRN